jgi:hypothetical protein
MPEQLVKIWDYIRFGVLSTASPITNTSPEGIRNILKNLLLGTIQCWAISEDSKMKGFVLTTISGDYVSGEKFLNIYDFYTFEQFAPETWENGIKALEEFAKANMCNKMTAYSDIPAIISISEKLGFRKDTVFLLKEVA